MVGLVEHGDLDRVEVHVALADEVLEASRAGDDDVDATGDGLDLRVLADATEDGARGQSECLGERGEGLVDLGRELARRGEDEGPRPTGLTPLARLGETGEDRQDERIRLA